MNYARRVESKSEIATARAPTTNEEKKVPLNRFRHKGGYQEKDALDELVLNLALDFANATECPPLEHLKEFTAFVDRVLLWVEHPLPKKSIERLVSNVQSEMKHDEDRSKRR